MFHKQGEEILAGTKEQQHRENPAFQAGGGLGSTHRIQLSEPGMRAEGMSPLLALGLLVAGLCSRVHCLPEGVLDLEKVTQEDQHREASVDNFTLASSNTNFAFSLYKQLALKTPDKNVIFSPLSVSMALAFLSLGARGTTLTEILEGLKFNLTETPESEIHQGFQHLLQTLGQPSNQLQLSVGNAMFVQEQLKLLDKFRDDARALYAAEVSSINFRDPDTAKSLINDYVKNKTQGKVVDLFKRLDPLTEVVLVNYIYFKAKWKLPFDPQVTNQAEFHVSENRSVEVPMMRIPSLVTPMFRDAVLGCVVVELQYTSNDSALFILPDEGRLEEVEAKLLPETLRRWRDSLHPSLIDELGLPKFSISSDYDLKDILPRLGIREVFTDKADLSGVNDSNDLKVTQGYHDLTHVDGCKNQGFQELRLPTPRSLQKQTNKKRSLQQHKYTRAPCSIKGD
ncbi:serpin A3-8 isoform X2 [Camelus bactrianus]|uniref:Serpin A3-8 isoform X2 n=1 Tax=Camelus bactrianus TaxID=9837 RepID=A0A9W3H7Q1_CAMBA